MLARVVLLLAAASLAACGEARPATTPAKVVVGASEAPAPAEGRAAPADGVRRLAAATFSTCAVRDDRRVVCWGENGEGQLGGGSAELRGPLEVPGVDDVVELAGGGGGESFCARRQDGAVWCWGARYGAPVRVPVLVEEPIHIDVQLVGCAVGARGDGSCWGGMALTPEGASLESSGRAVPLEDVSHVATSSVLGVLWTPADGALWRWWGEAQAPEPLGRLDDVIALESQASFRVCALTAKGNVRCFDPQTPTNPPTSSPPWLPPARDLALGVDWSCALARDEDGRIDCWDGDGGREPECNELFDPPITICAGPGPTPQLGLRHATPTVATSIPDAVEIIGGGHHLCARTRSGTVLCWGDNSYGGADPSADASPWLPEPTPVLSLADTTY